MQILESSENYLETIHMLQKKNGSVRSIDISNELNFTKASVSIAMKKLRENGYINMEADNTITLTEKGLNIAERIYQKHIYLTKLLTKIGVNEEIAKIDACKIEHIISHETFDCIKNFVDEFDK